LIGVRMWAPSGSTTMTKSHGIKAGDIILINFDPTLGSEQSGVRPAIVISSDLMHQKSKRIIVCPITGNLEPWPTKLMLPELAKTHGMVLTDQMRAIDIQSRFVRHLESLSFEFVTLVRSYVGRLLELEVAPLK
jgi:mRNA interferase MazF